MFVNGYDTLTTGFGIDEDLQLIEVVFQIACQHQIQLPSIDSAIASIPFAVVVAKTCLHHLNCYRRTVFGIFRAVYDRCGKSQCRH